MTRKPWKVSPAFDLIWLLPGLYVLPLVALLIHLRPEGMSLLHWGISFSISPAHLLAPVAALLLSAPVRKHVQSVNPGWKIHSLLIIGGHLALMAIALWLISRTGWSDAIIYLFGVIGISWLVWNTLHFAMQQFGMMRLYRYHSAYYSQGSRLFDFWSSMVLYAIIHPTIWAHYGLRTKMIKGMGINVEVPRPLFEFLPYVWGALLVLHIARSIKYREMSFPFQVTALTGFALTGLIYYHPLAYTLLGLPSIHWIQEIGLVYDRMERSLPHRFPLPRFINYLGLVAIGLGFVFFYSLSLIPSAFVIRPVLGVSHLKSFSPDLATIPIVLFFFINTFAFLHFYLDRFVHKKTAAI